MKEPFKHIISLAVIAGCSMVGCSEKRELQTDDSVSATIRPLDVQTLEQACKELRTADTFSWNVGWDTGPDAQTGGERALSVLIGSSDALTYFEALLTNATPAGQLYALCGIHKLAPARFTLLAAPLSATNLSVDTLIGCFSSRGDSVARNVAEIADGRYDTLIEAQPWRWRTDGSTNGVWTLAPFEIKTDQGRSP